jgi:hypothetical protein
MLIKAPSSILNCMKLRARSTALILSHESLELSVILQLIIEFSKLRSISEANLFGNFKSEDYIFIAKFKFEFAT